MQARKFFQGGPTTRPPGLLAWVNLILRFPWDGLRVCQKSAPGGPLGALDTVFYQKNLVGAIGLEPTTPTMSR